MKLAEWNLISQGYLCSNPNEYTLLNAQQHIRVSLYPTGAVKTRTFLVNGYFSRPFDEGPAYETFFEDGKPCEMIFSFMGAPSRPIDVGPAYLLFDNKQRLVCQEFWLDGKFIK